MRTAFIDNSQAAAFNGAMSVAPRSTPANTPEPASAAPLVAVEDLVRVYGTVEAVKGISFALRRGEVLGLLGPNGAGKSTTMQILSGNLAPTRGRVRILGHDLQEEPLAAKRALGYLPEYPPVYRELTVDEYLNFCARLRRVARGARAGAIASVKSRCGLTEVGHRLIGNLSKGYQQRVGFAQAILHSPPVIILDEPTVGLDPIQIREMRSLIRDLGREHGVILSTHILSEVQATCDRVQIIDRGRLVLNETIANLGQHLRSRALAVAFRQTPDPGALAALAGVTQVVQTDATHVRLLHAADVDPTDAVITLAAERAWGLYEITPEGASLEDIFVELTAARGASEPAPAVPAQNTPGEGP